jgi:hypothetical protein
MNASVYCPGISGIALSGVRLSSANHHSTGRGSGRKGAAGLYMEAFQ